MTIYFGADLDFTATPEAKQAAFDVVGTEDAAQPRIEITGANWVDDAPTQPIGSNPSEWALPSFEKKTNWALVLGLVGTVGLLAYVSTGSKRSRR